MLKKLHYTDIYVRINRRWGSTPREGAQQSLLWAASTAAAPANVTNASFISSTVPLQTTLTTLLACEEGVEMWCAGER